MRNDPALQLGVHFRNRSRRTLRLELADVLGSEQELPVQVALFDGIQIRDVNDTSTLTAQTHHAPVLEHFTTDRTRSDQELALFVDLLLKLGAKDGNLRVVPRVDWLTVVFCRQLGRQGFERVKVHRLHHWVELGTARLEDFLGDESTDDGHHRGNLSASLVRQLGEHLFVQRFLAPSFLGNLLGEGDYELGIVRVSWSRQTSVLVDKRGKRLETGVQRSGSIKLGKVGDEEFGSLQAFSEGFLRRGQHMSNGRPAYSQS